MSNSYVTLKVTHSYIFLFKFGFEIPKLTKSEIQKKIIIRKIYKTSSFRFFPILKTVRGTLRIHFLIKNRTQARLEFFLFVKLLRMHA